ncbi:MAG TPA: cyanophycinase [Oscillatoriaceae cyanobacterium]
MIVRKPFRAALAAALLLLAPFRPAHAAATGMLVAIGGGPEQPELIKQVLGRATGTASHVAIVDVASGEPAKSGPAYVRFFQGLGVNNVVVVPLQNRAQAYSDGAIAAIQDADLIYFTGGNQIKLVQAIAGTPAQGALLAAWQRGAVIAGTSAGAMVWGPRYLVAGESQPLLRGQGGLELREGLDLTPRVLIDPEFDREDRLGRLMVATSRVPGVLGLGVDERTAAVVSDDGIRVLGSGQVTVLDFSHAHDVSTAGPFDARDIAMHLLGAGDVLPFQRDDADRRPMLAQQPALDPLTPFLALQGDVDPHAALLAGRSGRVPDEVLILAGDGADKLAAGWRKSLMADGTPTVRVLTATQLVGDTLQRYLATASGVLMVDDAGHSLTTALAGEQGQVLRGQASHLSMAMAGPAVALPGETSVGLGTGDVLQGLRLAPHVIAQPNIWSKGALDRLVIDALLADGSLGIGLSPDNGVRVEGGTVTAAGASPVLVVDTSKVSMANPTVPTARDLVVDSLAPGDHLPLKPAQ